MSGYNDRSSEEQWNRLALALLQKGAGAIGRTLSAYRGIGGGPASNDTRFAALEPPGTNADARVRNMPVTIDESFDFSRNPDLINNYLWHKLLFEKQQLPGHMFYFHDRDRENLDPEVLKPTPLGPAQFR